MSKLRFMITMSLDGYVAGPDQSEDTRWASAGSDCTSGCIRSGRFARSRARRAARSTRARRWPASPRRCREAKQYLAAGHVDEMLISIVPVLLGGGARLFDNLGEADIQLEQVSPVEAPGVTHIKYRAAL
jgi:hypothetical protein